MPSRGEDNSEPGAIVGLTICPDRLHAGKPRLLTEYEIHAHSKRGPDDRITIGIINWGELYDGKKYFCGQCGHVGFSYDCESGLRDEVAAV